jgi:4-amino-4-deoxy-L-arabinose transferase-like glycosyltransferase
MASPVALPATPTDITSHRDWSQRSYTLILLAVGVLIYLGTILSPPSLLDDVDAVNAQIARNMLESGDWVTAHINGVLYLEKSPLGYWLMAVCYALFGVHDWAARLPTALASVALMWVTASIGRWGFGSRAGFYSGLAIGTSAGLFLFTRIVIPDVLLTLAVTAALYCFLRTVVDEDRRWAFGFWASVGLGLLLKGLLAALVPFATGGLYLLIRRQFFHRRTWYLLRPFTGFALMLTIYLPWVVAATWSNPPLFDLTLRSEPGVYRGFFWFYFINEHLLRFLNLRYPRDYNTVPRLNFLLLQGVWIFPWSVFLPAVRVKAQPAKERRAQSLYLIAILWIVFLLLFLSFSTTQEYYSMPCYPAFCLLVGAALTNGNDQWIKLGYWVLLGIGIVFAATAFVILYSVRGVDPVGDISSALTQNPSAYTLSLGHLQDLTLSSFAYLRRPLILAVEAMAVGTGLAYWFRKRPLAPLCLGMMMIVFMHASGQALAVFDPYLSSRCLADLIAQGPPGQLVIEGHYYPASSVVFYTNRPALLYNGRAENLIYGSSAPDAPKVFIDDADLARLWKTSQRLYLVVPAGSRSRLDSLLETVHVFGERGGKYVLSNHP